MTKTDSASSDGSSRKPSANETSSEQPDEADGDRKLHLDAMTPEVAPEAAQILEEVADAGRSESGIHRSGDDNETSEEIPRLDNECNEEKQQCINESNELKERYGSLSEEPSESVQGDHASLCSEEEVDVGESLLQPPPPLEEVGVGVSEQHELEEGVPYDRGWAWMVCVGCFMCFVCLSGYLKSTGMIFVELLRHFNAPASQTALLFSLRAGIFSISGLYVMNVVVSRLGARKTVLIGAAAMSLSAITSSFANELSVLICLQSLLLGLGMAMLISPGEVLMGDYFQKRRSLALAIAKCGASIGSIAVPPLITYLINEYGLRGTLLLYGGICLNTIPAALLLRPTSYFSKRHQRMNRKGMVQTDCNSSELDLKLQEDVYLETNELGDAGDSMKARKGAICSRSDVHGQGSDGVRDGGVSDSRQSRVNEVSGCISEGSSCELDAAHSPTNNPLVNKLIQDLRAGHSAEDSQSDSELGTSQPAMDKSNVNPSVHAATGAVNSTGGSRNKGLNKQINDLKPNHPSGGPHWRPTFVSSLSHDYDASMRKKDKARDAIMVSPLTTSFPELNDVSVGDRKSPLLLLKRTLSEPANEDDELSDDHTEHAHIRSSTLDLLTESKIVRYISASTLALGSMPVLCRYSSISHDATGSMEFIGVEEIEGGPGKGRGGKPRSRCLSILRKVLSCPKKAIFVLDFSLFRKPLFRLMLLYFMIAPTINCNLDYLPAIAVENGVTETEASLLLSIIGGLDLVCRLAAGFIADSGKIRVPTLIVITYTIMGVVNQFVRFLTTFPMFVALAVLQGLLGGFGNCLAVVLIIEFVGVENMGKAIGFTQLTSGAALAAIYPLLGFIRDATGSYAIVYHVIEVFILATAGLLSLEGVVRRWEMARQEKELVEIDVVVENQAS